MVHGWGKRTERVSEDGRGGRDGTLGEGPAGTVDGFDTFVVCSGLALEGLAVLCLEEDLGMFVDACDNVVKFS